MNRSAPSYRTSSKKGTIAMLKILSCKPQERQFNQVDQAQALSAIAEKTDQLFWLDLNQPTEQELHTIAEAFKLHPLAMEEATARHQRPKVEEYSGFFFLVFYAVRLNQVRGKVLIEEIKMFLGKNYLITVHQSPLPELTE